DFFHVVILEPISYIGTCATETRRDAGRGGEPEAICRYCEGSRQRDAPGSSRPLRGCGQEARGRRSSACAFTRRCDPKRDERAARPTGPCTPPRSDPRKPGPLLRAAARRLLRYPPRQYRHIAFLGCLAYGPSWPQRITRLVMKQVIDSFSRALNDLRAPRVLAVMLIPPLAALL